MMTNFVFCAYTIGILVCWILRRKRGLINSFLDGLFWPAIGLAEIVDYVAVEVDENHRPIQNQTDERHVNPPEIRP